MKADIHADNVTDTFMEKLNKCLITLVLKMVKILYKISFKLPQNYSYRNLYKCLFNLQWFSKEDIQ